MTEKLDAMRFRGQRVLVSTALQSFNGPKTLEEIAEKVEEAGYSKLLYDWAKQNGGTPGSVRYHLRALNKLGMVTIHGERVKDEKPVRKATERMATPPTNRTDIYLVPYHSQPGLHLEGSAGQFAV